MKILKRVLLLLLSIPVIVVIISMAINFPTAGKSIARDKNLTYHAVIAHRGASYLAPELTIPAFNIARDLGVDYIETDLQLTRDGVIINFHDETLKRTTNVSDIFPGRENDPVGSFTYKELMQLDAGSWFNRKNPKKAQKGFAGIKIPTFRQFLTEALKGKHKPGLLIEMKKPSKYPGIEKKMLNELFETGWLTKDYQVAVSPSSKSIDNLETTQAGLGSNRIIFQAFDENSLLLLKTLAPKVRRNFLFGKPEVKKHGYKNLLKIAEELDGEVGPVGYMFWPWYMRDAHKKNKYVFMWVIDKAWQFRLVTFCGADGIITNRSATILESIGRGVLQTPADLLKQYQ